jgi:ABC-2 type transport system permease protein
MIGLIAIETRLLLRSKLALMVLALLSAVLALAVANGRALLTEQMTARAAAAAEIAEATAKLQEQLAKGPPLEEAVLLPTRVRTPIVAPLPPLVDASAGRAAFEPNTATAGLRARADTMFRRTSLENPERLARGQLDLGFVAVVIAPLMLIALGAGLFSADRDSGAARLVLAQAGSVGALLVARSVPRLALVAVPILLALRVLLLAGPDVPGRAQAALLWALIALASLAVWWAAVLLVNSLNITAETAALGLVGLWALFTLVMPALITANAQLVHPAPSRFAEIAAARSAEINASLAWETDHPDLASDKVEARRASVARGVSINDKVEAAVAPVSQRFGEALAAQQALASRLAFLSPPLLASDAMANASGTDLAAAKAFRAAAARHLAEVKASLGAVIAGDGLLTPERLAGLPRFEPPRPDNSAALPALLWLGLLALLLAGLAARNFARVELA